nr:uncharacterized protein LOC108945632 [Nicotiana tomentosiformis]
MCLWCRLRYIFRIFISNRGIKVNPAQIKAIEEILDVLTSKKEVQRLTGKVAALGRFISKSSEKCFKLFSILKKQNQFEWTDECQQALKDLKSYLSKPPLLSKSRDRERLLVYLVVSDVAISMVLVRIDKDKQSPIYYVSKSLLDAETREENAEADALANLGSVADVSNTENAIVVHLFHSALDQAKNEYANNMHQPAEFLHSIIAPWPFMKSGMDIEGPLPKAPGKVREKKVVDFIWRNIKCRFDVPREIVCDNGPQFVGAKVTDFLKSWKIKRITLAPYHPVANGQEESTNKVIVNNLKKRLEATKGKWPEVLPRVLWAYKITTKISTGETQFSLIYGTEALIPVEIGKPSTRYVHENEASNEEELRTNLDLTEDKTKHL